MRRKILSEVDISILSTEAGREEGEYRIIEGRKLGWFNLQMKVNNLGSAVGRNAKLSQCVEHTPWTC